MSDYEFQQREAHIDAVRYDDPMKASDMQWQLQHDRTMAAARQQEYYAAREACQNTSPGNDAYSGASSVGAPSPPVEIPAWKYLVWAGTAGLAWAMGLWPALLTSGPAASKAMGLIAVAVLLTCAAVRNFVVGCIALFVFAVVLANICVWSGLVPHQKPAASARMTARHKSVRKSVPIRLPHRK